MTQFTAMVQPTSCLASHECRGHFLSQARPGKITFASVFTLMIEFVRKYLHHPAKVRFLIPLGTKMKAHQAFPCIFGPYFPEV